MKHQSAGAEEAKHGALLLLLLLLSMRVPCCVAAALARSAVVEHVRPAAPAAVLFLPQGRLEQAGVELQLGLRGLELLERETHKVGEEAPAQLWQQGDLAGRLAQVLPLGP